MRPRKLTLVPLAAATYFMVSGGPYGLEELVQDCGYGTGLLILLLIPLVWSLPTGLMVGELSAAIPDEGGFYVWVRRAMGPFWGFQEAWLSLVASVFDMAAYPALFVLYLGRLWPQATQGYNGMLIGAAVVGACVLWNLAGARAVGTGSVLLGTVLLSPFLLIVIFALVRHPALGNAPAGAGGAQGGLLAGIMVAMWNYMGWDNASTVAAEVENPQRTYPRVMMVALAAIVLSYVIPVAAVWRTHVPPAYWATGSWAGIAALVAGPSLGIALVVAAMISSVGIINSLTMSYSRLPIAMAEAGCAPRMFLRRLPNGVPWVSILVCGLAWTAALGLSFDRLLMLDILLYGASLVLEFVALVVLRWREPGLDRPFTIPGGLGGAVLTGVGPAALLIVALIRNRAEQMGRINALTLGLILMAAGVVVWYVAAWARKTGRPA
ncbi:MAG: APC family permease [Bryobacteraceae bacterium]|jgi:amino acid transporter